MRAIIFTKPKPVAERIVGISMAQATKAMLTAEVIPNLEIITNVRVNPGELLSQFIIKRNEPIAHSANEVLMPNLGPTLG